MGPGRAGHELELAARAPVDTDGLIAFFAARAVRGVEEVTHDGAYRRSVRLPRGAGVIEVAPDLRARFWLDAEQDLDAAIGVCRRLFDLDTDPAPIANALGDDPLIGPLVRAAPGRRVPGAADRSEIAFRAVLGQQVSVAGAATTASRLTAAHGEPLRNPVGNVTHLFPAPEALADAEPALPRARVRAIRGLARALAAGDVDLAADRDHVERSLLALPGIGPWTVGYIAMRALGDRDRFLAADLGVRRALERLGRPGDPNSAAALAECWRPYRAYANQHLWATLG